MCSHVIVIGVSGSGKSAVAEPLAMQLGFEFVEGDEYHPTMNIEKMSAGIPLSDADRWPWLRALADLLIARHDQGISTVLACSALRRAYRDVLRATVPRDESFVIALDADEATLRARLEHRRGHYMPTSLLDSQLATLEPLEPDEIGATVDASGSLDALIADAVTAVRAGHGTLGPGR